MATRWGLRQRITVGLILYVMFLSLAIALHGYIVNEDAEQLVWESLLRTELDYYVHRRQVDPTYAWPDSESLELFTTAAGRSLPSPLADLPPGVHDDILVDGRERVLLVRDISDERLVLALDIDSIERTEHRLGWVLTGSALAMVLVLAGVAAWGVGRLTQPLRDLAATIAKLQPQRASEVVTLAPGATVELVVIADAMNDYLRRNDRFVEREHAFIDNASHELRTPIAVIAGAAEVALDNGSLPGAVALQLTRIRHAARDMEQLITLLLVLAKDPARLADISEHVALDELLPRIVDDHRHLCRNKLLTVRIEDLPACTVNAPAHIVRAALGNLLRNAIENSDRGEIVLSLDAEGKVSIQDPGRGMSAEEVSEIYSRLARGGARNDAGIGLALIGRLCEHLRWVLTIQSEVGLGSRVTLDFSASRAASIS